MRWFNPRMVCRTFVPLALLVTATAFPASALAVPPAADAPDSPYETRGNAPVDIRVSSDAPGRTFTVTTPAAGGSVSTFTPDGDHADATYTANDGFAGSDSFVVEVSDGTESAQVTVDVAVRPPTVALSGPGVGMASTVTSSATPTFTYEARTGSARIGGATFRCKIDTGAFVACNGGGHPANAASYTTPTLSDGVHSITLRAATDGGLNVDDQPPTIAFVVDTTAPAIDVDSGPASVIGPNSASFAFTAGTDPNGGVATTCRLITPSNPSPSFTACSSPQGYSSLEEGAHTFEVRATDIAGNSSVDSHSFTVADNAPVADDESVETEGTDPIEVTASDVDGDTLDYSVDTPPTGGSTSTASNRVTYTADPDFAGADTFSYTASDGRGGTDSATVSVTVHPQTAITDDPGATTGVGRPEWAFSSGQADSYECQFAPTADYDNSTGTWEPCTSPFQPPTNQADGSYTFGVRGIANGDPDPTPATHTTTVTNGGPGIGALSFDTEATDPVTDSVGPAQDADGDPLTYTLADGPGLGSLEDDGDLPAFTYTADADKAGVDTFDVLVEDDRGASETVTVTVNVAPPTTVGSLTSPNADTTPTWTFGSPIEGATFEYSLDGGAWTATTETSFTPDTALSDGTHTLEVRAIVDGVTDPTPASQSVDIDATAPDVAFDTVPADGNLDARPVVAWHTVASDLATTEYRWYRNGEEPPAFETATSPVVLPKLTDNVQHFVEIRVTDQLGNAATYTTQWLQSNTAPVADAKSADVEGGDGVAIDLSGTDADPGDTADLTFDVASEPSNGTVTVDDADTVTYTADEDFAGTDTFTYTADDGRQGGTNTATVTVTVTPKTVIDTAPDEFTSDVTPTWTFSSPVAGATLECSLDSAAWEDCSAGTYTAASDLADGDHTLEVRATAATLTDPTPASSTITVDTDLPDVSIDTDPGAESNDPTPAFTFSSTDPNTPAPTFECRVDTGDWAACTSGADIASQADGLHTFEVRAVDRAGNRSATPASHTWEVDATAPALTRDSGPNDDNPTNSRRPVWTFSHSDPNGHDAPLTATCQVDSGTVTTSCLSPYQPGTNLSDGPHTLHLTVTDSFGNTGTLDVDFSVDTIAPSVAITERPDHPSGSDATFEFTSGENDATYECSLRPANATSGTWDACTSPKAYTGLSSGTRKFLVRAIDPAGNESESESYIWETIGGTPDTDLRGAKPATGTTETSAAFSFGSDDPVATFECSFDGSTYAACTAPVRYNGLAVGSHTFKVRAVNSIGTTDATPAEHTWTIAAPPPPPAATDETPPANSGNNTPPPTAQQQPQAQTPQQPQTPQAPACNALAASALTAPKFTAAKGVSFKLRLSHKSARVGQDVTVSLVLGGKAKPKTLSKYVKSIALLDGTKTVVTLKGSKWTATFTPRTVGSRKLTIKMTPKKGSKKTAGTLTLGVEAAC